MTAAQRGSPSGAGRNRARVWLGAAAMVMLAGCSSDPTMGDGWRIARESLRSVATSGKATGAATPQLTREAADQSPLPLLIATIESRKATAVLGRINTNAGTETFSTSDRVEITTRGGVVISTRGFGADLMSSSAPSGAGIMSGRGSHSRILDHLDGLDRTVRSQFACTLGPAGSETITIVGLSYSTRIVTESCAGTAGSFENRYWIDGRGKIRQSRQWIGAGVGFLLLSDPGRG